MPAKSAAQLRAAYAAADKGESWGQEMVKATPESLKKRWMSTTKPKKRPKKRAKTKGKAKNKGRGG